ncbi:MULTISPECIES: hypothetical protein [unclassified Nocardioides]|jgi:hypothetical protein|uniref:hypothetical protein n=1 Tax=unclassified Nocardioides TaxID=2615069 RepID=UPI00115220DC|nr:MULTISPECIES: hypothetical protein [unclassified Nocardioides]TQK68419.1 hypothetical protein FBY23_0167 [Nocardioides sp. SLBN-35]WGY02268.1 hypothetical protein QI633_00585 [Nocardioides sp. QY071]
MAFLGGPEAAARVAADPFWSVVRRRHPDVELVLLPPAGPAEPAEQLSEQLREPIPQTSLEAATAECAARVAELWDRLVGATEPDEWRDRWTTGATPEVSRHEATWTRLGMEPVTAAGVLERAAALLGDEDWRVLTPPDGMPRVLAGRPVRHGREEIDLVLVPATGRFFLTVRSGPYLLDGAR